MACLKQIVIVAVALAGFSCNWEVPQSDEGLVTTVVSTDSFTAIADTGTYKITKLPVQKGDSVITDNTRNKDTLLQPSVEINVKNIDANELMQFAETLKGTPYVYASTNPKTGFDCSGFITYVFNHFGIRVPRSSVDFTNAGKQIPVEAAKRGDIILFTGTNPAERHVGHMGLVVSNSDTLQFIHASSGKAMGVTVTPLNNYYMGRFVKTIRVFPQHD